MNNWQYFHRCKMKSEHTMRMKKIPLTWINNFIVYLVSQCLFPFLSFFFGLFVFKNFFCDLDILGLLIEFSFLMLFPIP